MLRDSDIEEAGETRYDSAALGKVTALAQRLQSQHQDTLTAREIEQIGAEVGLAPDFIRQALQQVSEVTPPARGRSALRSSATLPAKTSELATAPAAGLDAARWRTFARAWWAAAWTVPLAIFFFSTNMQAGPGGLQMALFLMGWAIYISVGILLSHRRDQPAQAATGGAPVPRLALLEMVFALQRELEGRKRFSAFLSVDVAGSSAMKRGASELDAEYSFGQFSGWVTEVVRRCSGEVQSAAGDGLMCRFPSEALAVRAARTLQEGLEAFNAQRNRLATPFRIRCGISAGEVPLEEGVPAGYVHSAVIDRAAALQKQAEPGDIVVSQEVAAAALVELGALAQLPGASGDELAFSWRAGAPAALNPGSPGALSDSSG